MTPGLSVVSVHGSAGASHRVRVDGWVDRLAPTAEVTTYLGAGTSAPGTLLRRPVGVLSAERRLRSRPADDVLLLHREASPLSRGALESRLLSRARLGVYDLDDALQWDRGWDRSAGSRLRRLAPKAGKCLAAVRAADRVLVGNAVLADWASTYAREVLVVPSCVEPADYVVPHPVQRDGRPRLGWIGTPSTERYLLPLAPALQELNRRTGARLTVVSAGSATLPGLDDLVDRVPWTAAGVATSLARFDVGLSPLQDGAYARGKCAYKLLQYGAAGVPAVGTPVGVNREVLADLGGRAASTTGEWVEAVEELLGLPDADRARLSARAREAVARRWSYEAWEPVVRRALELPDGRSGCRAAGAVLGVAEVRR